MSREKRLSEYSEGKWVIVLKNNIESFMSYYESRKKLIEDRIEQLISNVTLDPIFERTNVREMLLYSLKGGKKLRGVLTLLICEELGGNVERALDAAVAVELIHNASLIHDDIIDGDEIRRNKLSFWKRYGISAAIIIGHYLVSLGLMLFRKYGWRAIEVFNRAWINIVKGGIADITRSSSFDEKIYKVIAKLKTGEFFAVAAVMGAISAEKTEYEELAYRYGSSLGLTFQIADDIVDIVNMVRKRSDAVKFSPSLIAFLTWISENKKIKEIAKLALFSKSSLSTIITEENILDKAATKLQQHLIETLDLASKFPQSPLKIYLKIYPQIAIAKMLDEAREYIDKNILNRILTY